MFKQAMLKGFNAMSLFRWTAQTPLCALAIALLHAWLQAELDAQALLPFMPIHKSQRMQLLPGMLILHAQWELSASTISCDCMSPRHRHTS